jgi:hypothetical protein
VFPATIPHLRTTAWAPWIPWRTTIRRTAVARFVVVEVRTSRQRSSATGSCRTAQLSSVQNARAMPRKPQPARRRSANRNESNSRRPPAHEPPFPSVTGRAEPDPADRRTSAVAPRDPRRAHQMGRTGPDDPPFVAPRAEPPSARQRGAGLIYEDVPVCAARRFVGCFEAADSRRTSREQVSLKGGLGTGAKSLFVRVVGESAVEPTFGTFTKPPRPLRPRS